MEAPSTILLGESQFSREQGWTWALQPARKLELLDGEVAPHGEPLLVLNECLVPCDATWGKSLGPGPVKWQLLGRKHAMGRGCTVVWQLQAPKCKMPPSGYRSKTMGRLCLEHTQLCHRKGVSGGAFNRATQVNLLLVSPSEVSLTLQSFFGPALCSCHKDKELLERSKTFEMQLVWPRNEFCSLI